jgi:Abortive infection C-terminus
MTRPRIYGNEKKARAAVARHIAPLEDLLEQAEGVRNRIAAAGLDPVAEVTYFTLLQPTPAFELEIEWGNQLRKELNRVRRTLGPYLQDQFEELLPTAAFVPPDTEKRRHIIVLGNGVPNLRNALEELRRLQDAVGVRRDVAPTEPAPPGFEELHASGLVDEKVIADHEKGMRAPRTPKQLADAIGSAKELTEATLRAALDRLEVPYRSSDDLPSLMKKWRKAVAEEAAVQTGGDEALDKALAALANVVTFLAEWRNAYGRGHGRPRYPPGLKSRHARIAADAAQTCIRFIVITMDDLERLPPRAEGPRVISDQAEPRLSSTSGP